ALDSGNRAVFRWGRSLALRPRLTPGLPWTVVHRGADIAPTRTVPVAVPSRQATVVPVAGSAGVIARRHRRMGAAVRSHLGRQAAAITRRRRPRRARSSGLHGPSPGA